VTGDVAMLVIAAVLVLVAGVLVGAETAIGRVSRSRVEELRREGARGSVRLSQVVEDRARYVNVLLFLHLCCSTMAIVLVAHVATTTWSGDREWLALVGAAAIMVVIGYVVLGVAPRTLGRQHADRIALAAAGPARALAVLLTPLTAVLILVGNALTPGKGYREGPFATAAELRALVDLAEADDLIEDDERRMIHSVFELGDTIAREVMVPRTEMVWVERSKTLRQALSLGLRSGFSRIPVVGEDADDVVGVVYLKDIVRRVFENREAEQTVRVDKLMRSASFVPDSKRADDLLREMQAARTHMAIVVDEYGGTAGIVTIEDILEEIVGEIDDEYDTAAPEVERLAGGQLRVSARMNIDDFAELVALDIDGEEEGVETVGGLIGRRLGRVPIPGSEVVVDGWTLVAEERAGRRNRISAVLVTPPPADDDVEADVAEATPRG
jgi:CBS domain containing-hemolysin-like protein